MKSRKLSPNNNKLRAVLLFIMNEGPGMSARDIFSAMYIADKHHLNDYGRPISFDYYLSHADGPVPALTKMIISDSPTFKRGYRKFKPWEIKNGLYYVTEKPKRLRLSGRPSVYLSKSDAIILKESVHLVLAGVKNFDNDRAFIEARALGTVRPLDLRLMFDEQHDKEIIVETIHDLLYYTVA